MACPVFRIRTIWAKKLFLKVSKEPLEQQALLRFEFPQHERMGSVSFPHQGCLLFSCLGREGKPKKSPVLVVWALRDPAAVRKSGEDTGKSRIVQHQFLAKVSGRNAFLFEEGFENEKLHGRQPIRRKVGLVNSLCLLVRFPEKKQDAIFE